MNIQIILTTFIKKIVECHPNKKRKIFIAFDDMIAHIPSSKKLICNCNLFVTVTAPIVTELFIRGRKLNIFRKSYFAVPKRIGLNSAHYFIMKITNKLELQQIPFNHSSDIEFKDCESS